MIRLHAPSIDPHAGIGAQTPWAAVGQVLLKRVFASSRWNNTAHWRKRHFTLADLQDSSEEREERIAKYGARHEARLSDASDDSRCCLAGCNGPDILDACETCPLWQESIFDVDDY